jgi:lysophospholipase L1-like esterase
LVGLTPVDEDRTTPLGELYHTNQRQWEYDRIVERVCSQTGAVYLDVAGAIGTLSSDIGAIEYDPTLLADGLHPNSEGHRRLFKIFQPQIVTLA